MKSRAQELVEKSVAAMVSAIEIYNKPDFKYREETFAILAINAWELLLKAKWLVQNNNRARSLYVMEKRNRPSGKPYKHLKVKLTECGNPFTHSLDYLGKKLLEKGSLPEAAYKNIKALSEVRDSSVHFYNRHSLFALRLQEVGSASVKNFVRASQAWFDVDLTEFNFYLMPLAFLAPARNVAAVPLNREEKNLASYIAGLEAANDPTSEYAVSRRRNCISPKNKSKIAIRSTTICLHKNASGGTAISWSTASTMICESRLSRTRSTAS